MDVAPLRKAKSGRVRASVTALMLAAVSGSCSSSASSTAASSSSPVGTTSTSAAAALGSQPLRVEVSTGCPASVPLAHHGTLVAVGAFIDNPDTHGLAEQLVPGTPSAALVCRYTNAVSPDGVGTLYASKALTRSQTDQLAAAARAIVPLVGQTESCGAHFGDNRYTVLAFAVPGRSDVDIWFQSDLDCTGLTNGLFTVAIGTRESGEFHTLLDSMAPPPPYSG